MSTISTRAAPHARAWSDGTADSDSEKIVTGMFGSDVPKMLTVVLLEKIPLVNSNGAVSPAARATASTVPVRIPPSAEAVS
jgi:hypothetical protein